MTQETLGRINAKKINPKDITVKPLKTREKWHITYTGATIKPSGYFSTGVI